MTDKPPSKSFRKKLFDRGHSVFLIEQAKGFIQGIAHRFPRITGSRDASQGLDYVLLYIRGVSDDNDALRAELRKLDPFNALLDPEDGDV